MAQILTTAGSNASKLRATRADRMGRTLGLDEPRLSPARDDLPMVANARLRGRGNDRAMRFLREFGNDVLDARIRAGVSQDDLGRRLGTSGDKVGRIEHARLPTLSFLEASELAAVLGLDLVARTYPNGAVLRDAGQARKLAGLLAHVGPPLTYRTEVPLPRLPDQPVDLRGWDAVLYGHARRTAVELEARFTDAQAMTRRHNLKRRDDPVDRFLLVVGDTRHNRQVIREYPELFAELPCLRTATVLRLLAAGEHPPTGLILF